MRKKINGGAKNLINIKEILTTIILGDSYMSRERILKEN